MNNSSPPISPIRSSIRSPLANLAHLFPVIMLICLTPFALRSDMGGRMLLAGIAFLGIYALRSSGTGVLFALIYLAFLGGMRRNLIPVLGWAGLDPFLLVCPIMIGLVFLNKAFLRQIPRDTWVSRLILWLLIVMALQIFNPLQGGLEVGLAGAIFFIAPVLWFYAGRDLGTREFMAKLFSVVVGIAILAALYGLGQTFYGFTPGEQQWINITRIASLNVGGSVRAISFLSNPAEYDHFLGIGFAILWAYWLRTRNFVALLPLPLLALAIFLQSGRTPIVLTLFACAVLVAVQGRHITSWIPRGLVVLALGISGLVWSLQQVQQGQYSQETASLVQHQTEGLLNPLDEQKSTADIHANMISGGFLAGLRDPLGHGLGFTTLAASKFQVTGGSTEMDLSDIPVSLGAVGGILYLSLFVLILVTALRYWHQDRSIISLSVLGLLAVSIGSWISDGQYAAGMLIWFCIGAMDRAQREIAR